MPFPATFLARRSVFSYLKRQCCSQQRGWPKGHGTHPGSQAGVCIVQHIEGSPFVAAINDAVARLQVLHKQIDGGVHRLPRHDQHDHPPGSETRAFAFLYAGALVEGG